MYKGDWKRVAEHVWGRTQDEPLLRQLIEDSFLEDDTAHMGGNYTDVLSAP